jgi:hypothetical protein
MADFEVASLKPVINGTYSRVGSAIIYLTNNAAQSKYPSTEVALPPRKGETMKRLDPETLGRAGGSSYSGIHYDIPIRGMMPANLQISVSYDALTRAFGTLPEIEAFDAVIEMEVSKLSRTGNSTPGLSEIEIVSDKIRSRQFRLYVMSERYWNAIDQAEHALVISKTSIERTRDSGGSFLALWYVILILVLGVVGGSASSRNRSKSNP